MTNITRMTGVDLTSYDWIVVNSSAGKDSQAMLTYIAEQAAVLGITHRLVVVHCDLGRVEWEGTKALAKDQARHYGLRFEVVANKRDFLQRVEDRGQWPDAKNRYCTSEFKTNPVKTLFTALAKETRSKLDGGNGNRSTYRVRILNCIGIRAEESPGRAKKQPLIADSETRTTKDGKLERNSRREITQWYPIFRWNVGQVWETIRESAVPYHRAYDLGMPRLSCVFCIFAPEKALTIAGYHNRALLAEYTALEGRMNHTFRHKQPLINIELKLEAGYVPAGTVADWDDWDCAA
jgi:3'-phosphoadenosine 5'-phosphosulfate sulfotransferase (PAPS reductase)/FAD synthetase